MRRCSRRSRELAALAVAVVAVVAVAAVAGCGGGVVVSLILKPGLNDVTQTKFDTTSLQSLLVLLTSGDKVDAHALTLDATAQVPITPGNGIDKTAPVGIEVRGCETATCERNSDVRFRGCNPPADLSKHDSSREGELPIDVEMFPVGDAHLDGKCPPFNPAG